MNDATISAAQQRRQLAPVVGRLHAAFAGTFGEQTVERLLFDSYDRLRAGARYHTYLPVLAERFAREPLTATAKNQGLTMTDVPTVLFLCVHNAGRSQMAAGWLQHFAGDRITVLSGGSAPADGINPTAVEAMDEVGIDITSSYPKPWTEETLETADIIVTMGCGDACPVLPGKRYLDWELTDPAGRDIDDVRPIRDDIAKRVRNLMAELGVEPPPL